jgi:hypothetical protein
MKLYDFTGRWPASFAEQLASRNPALQLEFCASLTCGTSSVSKARFFSFDLDSSEANSLTRSRIQANGRRSEQRSESRPEL